MMPAMNSLPMSCSVMMPYTQSPVDGGSMAPSVPPGPRFTSVGRIADNRTAGFRIGHGRNVAAVATDEPQMAAKPPHAATVAIPIRRANADESVAARNSSRLMPEIADECPPSAGTWG